MSLLFQSVFHCFDGADSTALSVNLLILSFIPTLLSHPSIVGSDHRVYYAIMATISPSSVIFIWRWVGGSHQELQFTGDSVGCHLGHALQRLLPSQGPAGTPPPRTDAEAAENRC